MTDKEAYKVGSILVDLENARPLLRRANQLKRELKKGAQIGLVGVWLGDDDDSFDFGQYAIDNNAMLAALDTYIRVLKANYKAKRDELRRARIQWR